MIYVTSNKKSITQQTIWTIRHDSLQKQVAAFKKVIVEIKIQCTEYNSPRSGFVLSCCLSCYCQQSHNTLSILQYLYEQIQIIPPQAFIYIRRQMLAVGPNYHKQSSRPLPALMLINVSAVIARLSLSNSSNSSTPR